MMIDIYQERTGPGLWGEPWNTLTNAAFFIAAWAAWRFARRRGVRSADVRALVALLALIGAGSALFHLFATEWARLLDVLPILLFQLLFLWAYGRTVLGAVGGAGLLAAFFAAAHLCAAHLPHGALNGSLMYAPAWLFLLLLGAYHGLRRLPGRVSLLAAGGTFTVSLFFRTIDLTWGACLPMGTHFFWHLLNGLTLYLCLRALIAARAA